MAVFGDINEAKVLGNITQDIELRHTPSGTPVTNFSVATNRSYKVDDEWKEEATFHNIVVWGNDAEYLAQRARKGTRIYIGGRLQTRSWEDQDGKKNYKTEIVSNKIILLDRYEKGEKESIGDIKKENAEKKKQTNKEETIDPDDLPF
ncbi:single-stranded DNA-binding protein [Candidatus Dojkabacteria bacterium]|nr:single-stranded DNA-binding protein [Candidatus Dojkabacteria bacterium]